MVHHNFDEARRQGCGQGACRTVALGNLACQVQQVFLMAAGRQQNERKKTQEHHRTLLYYHS